MIFQPRDTHPRHNRTDRVRNQIPTRRDLPRLVLAAVAVLALAVVFVIVLVA